VIVALPGCGYTEISSAMTEGAVANEGRPFPIARPCRRSARLARVGSVVGAARELAVSPVSSVAPDSAIGAPVGVPLISGGPDGGLKLTVDGEQLAGAVVPALANHIGTR